MVAGLDEWDRFRDDLPRIRERHLERVLNKRYFLAPPLEPDRQYGFNSEQEFPVIPAVRFPRWLVCERCDRLGVVGRELKSAVPVRSVEADNAADGESQFGS